MNLVGDGLHNLIDGLIIGLWLGSALDFFVVFIVPFTAGGFIYIAGSDLIPELHKESKPSRSLLQFIGIIIGIGIMIIMI